MKEGPGEGTKCQATNVHAAIHGRTRSEKSREAVPRSGGFDHFPLHCPTALKRTSCSRPCCTVFGGAYVGSLSSSPSRGGPPRASVVERARGLQHRCLTLSSTPSERKTYPKWSVYICTLLVFSPTKSVVYICDLTPFMSDAGLPLFPHQHQPFPLMSSKPHAQTTTAYSLPCHHIHSRSLPCRAATDPPRARAGPWRRTTGIVRSLWHLSV